MPNKTDTPAGDSLAGPWYRSPAPLDGGPAHPTVSAYCRVGRPTTRITYASDRRRHCIAAQRQSSSGGSQ